LAPAAAVIAITAVLFPLLASPGQGEKAGGATTGPVAASGATATTATTATTVTASTTAASTSGATPSGNALLVIEQDGAAVALALVSAGQNGGVVLGLPGVMLLRSGDRFAQLAQLYGQHQQQAVVGAVADALAVPVGAVASVDWVDLRVALTNEGIERLPPLHLDAKDGDTAAIAEALAAAFSKRWAGAGAPLWNELSLAGDADRFRAAAGAALLAAEGTGWTGNAVIGTLVQNAELIYLEPDIKTARSVLTSTDTGG
jgi:hypothetical protein